MLTPAFFLWFFKVQFWKENVQSALFKLESHKNLFEYIQNMFMLTY